MTDFEVYLKLVATGVDLAPDRHAECLHREARQRARAKRMLIFGRTGRAAF